MTIPKSEIICLRFNIVNEENYILCYNQGWGAGYFLYRLRLLIFFPSGSGSCFFFKRLRLQGAKNMLLTLG